MSAVLSGFKVETYNAEELIYDGTGQYFNVSALIKKYQPKTKNISRYLTTNKFSTGFDEKADEYIEISKPSLVPQKGEQQEVQKSPSDQKVKREITVDSKSFRGSFITLNAGCKREYQGIYAPIEYRDILLMTFSAKYREVVANVMKRVDIYTKERAAKEGKTQAQVLAEFNAENKKHIAEYNRYAHLEAARKMRAPSLDYKPQVIPDCVIEEEERRKASDKMW
jgi:hypothetical protein